MAKTLEELAQSNKRLRGAQQCRNVMGYYLYLASGFRNKEYMEYWADREDSCLDMPWGGYIGKQKVADCYLHDHGDISDEEYPVYSAGIMCCHEIASEVLEVAEDGLTARAIHVSAGTETYNEAPVQPRNTGYCWARYGTDFINVDGEWKIWHMTLCPGTICNFHTSWADMPHWEGYPFMTHTDYGMHHWQYSREAVYPVDRPAYPRPYKTFDDIAPGYAYEV